MSEEPSHDVEAVTPSTPSLVDGRTKARSAKQLETFKKCQEARQKKVEEIRKEKQRQKDAQKRQKAKARIREVVSDDDEPVALEVPQLRTAVVDLNVDDVTDKLLERLLPKLHPPAPPAPATAPAPRTMIPRIRFV